ncbi:ROK family protein [Peribacillus loiseleuriae]|uniref:ROK family protein n=1 Tax=Peribacillus loiseleuriae TaxID=1679170 RepID=UPI00381899EB
MNYYAALDVGGSSIKYALMDETGCFIEKSSLPTPQKSLTKFMDTVDSIVKELQKSHLIKGLAVSMPGAVNVETVIIEGVTALPYIHGPNMKDLLRPKCYNSVPIRTWWREKYFNGNLFRVHLSK